MTGHRFNPEKADKLMSAERRKLLPIDKVIELLELHAHDTVADLGAGNGYFTIPFAKQTKKSVYAVDIEPKMLELLKMNAEKERLKNIHYIESDLEHIQLEDSSVNKVLIAFVMHEVGNMVNALNEVKRILKPQGKLLILEWEAIESEQGPPLHERIPSKEMEKFLRDHGFDVQASHLNEAVYAMLATLS